MSYICRCAYYDHCVASMVHVHVHMKLPLLFSIISADMFKPVQFPPVIPLLKLNTGTEQRMNRVTHW